MRKRLVLLTILLSSFFITSYGQQPAASVPKTNKKTTTVDTKKTVEDKKRSVRMRKPKQSIPVVAVERETEEGKPEVEIDQSVNEFNPEERKELVTALVGRGIEFCKTHHLEDICQAFTHTKNFVEGELYLFLLDTKGVVYAHGREMDLLWKNLWEWRDMFGSLIIQSIIKKAHDGGGWITYEWDGAAKVSLVNKVEIGGKEYVLGCGYYPHSKEYATVGLVKGAVALFNQVVAEGRPVEDAFSVMSYKMTTRFLFGDLYLYALDFNGVIFAQGERPGLVETSAWEYKHDGQTVNQEIINKLKEKDLGEGIWVEYRSKNALKRAYAEKVQDSKGKFYFIASGYYPEINRDVTMDFVRRGYQFMKASGLTEAIRQFNDQLDTEYRKGDLALFLYDLKGNCLANGRFPDIVGQNHLDLKDSDGRYYIREMIDRSTADGAWVNFKLNNSFESFYVQKIDMGAETYVIGSGMYPISKPETVHLLVRSAVSYFKRNTLEQAAERFVNRKDEFLRGDLYLFIVDQDGFCYAWGDDFNKIWRNILPMKDEAGNEFIKNIVHTAAHGADSIVIKSNKRPRVIYFEQVEKDNKKYVIGSGFYK